MKRFNLFNKLRNFIIKILGGISGDEAHSLIEKIANRNHRIAQLEEQLDCANDKAFSKVQTVMVERLLVEPIVLGVDYKVPYGEFGCFGTGLDDEIRDSIVSNIIKQLAEQIVTNNLFEVLCLENYDPICLERNKIIQIRVRVVPPRKEYSVEKGEQKNGRAD